MNSDPLFTGEEDPLDELVARLKALSPADRERVNVTAVPVVIRECPLLEEEYLVPYGKKALYMFSVKGASIDHEDKAELCDTYNELLDGKSKEGILALVSAEIESIIDDPTVKSFAIGRTSQAKSDKIYLGMQRRWAARYQAKKPEDLDVLKAAHNHMICVCLKQGVAGKDLINSTTSLIIIPSARSSTMMAPDETYVHPYVVLCVRSLTIIRIQSKSFTLVIRYQSFFCLSYHINLY